jgi:AraC-like DNA-binding protein
MPRLPEWRPERCQRLELALSEQVPIRLSCGQYRRRGDLAFDVHYGFELGIVRRGRIVRRYKDCELRLGPGEAWLCGLWEPHSGRVIQAPCEVVVWVIWPPLLAGLRFEEAAPVRWTVPFTVPPARRPRVARADRGAIRELAARGRRVVDSTTGIEQQLRLRLLLVEALLLLRRKWNAAEEEAPASSDEYSRINRAVQLVFEARRPVPTAEAARACATSRSHFDRLFARQMGLSFARFELRHRLHGAARELLQGEAPLKAIAAAWGFTDASHFLRRFREYYACSPKQYRQNAGMLPG